MFLEFSDWLIYADIESNRLYAEQELSEHCLCAFCRNFYNSVDSRYPNMRYFLSRFGLEIEAPDSLIPITETLYQVSYEAEGRVLRWGSEPIQVGDFPVTVEEDTENSCIVLNLGLMELPWSLEESPDSVKKTVGIPDLFADFKKEKTQQ